MNAEQRLWWRQSQSDHGLFVELRGGRIAAHECHLLHYLQMATEKLSKAYLWRSGHAPPNSHTGFVRFLRALLTRPDAELGNIALALGFNNHLDLNTWVRNVLPLAYDLQNIAPAEAHNGQNPEYPWPHETPTHCPSDHSFPLWSDCVIQVKVASFWDLFRSRSNSSTFSLDI